MHKQQRRLDEAGPSNPSMARRQVQTTITNSLPVSSDIQSLNYGFSSDQIIYSIPISLGGVSYRVKVSTGSSDLWLAGRSCRSAQCSGSGATSVVTLYDNTGTATNQNFDSLYLDGDASGPIYTQSQFTLGSGDAAIATLATQAIGSATTVDGVQLPAMNVSGILGLGLPANSSIQAALSPDAAADSLPSSSATGSVLSGIWSAASDGQRLFSLGLQRLPSDGGSQTANSSLAIGGIDPDYLSALQYDRVQFSEVLADLSGDSTHWTTYLTDITATEGGMANIIPLSFVGERRVFPTVVLDSGSPLNYAPSDILNALYGTYFDASGNRIGPGNNGVYYVPCNTPLNLTLTVGGAVIPIHPLDASLYQDSASGSSSDGCIGSFQSLTVDSPAGADVVLGTPFLRSAYSIYSCDPIPTNSSTSGDGQACTPTIGLYGTTTNLTEAFEQFNTVRVQGTALGDNAAYGIGVESGSSGGLSTGGKIAIGIVCALAGLIGLFILLVFVGRGKARRAREADEMDDGTGSHRGDYSREKGSTRRRSSMGQTLSAESPFEDQYDDAGGVGASRQGLSAKEQARLREAALLHGVYDDQIFAGNDSSSFHDAGPAARADNRPDFGVTSTGGNSVFTDGGEVDAMGYRDAARIKRKYLERHPSLEMGRRSGGEPSSEGIELQERRHDSSSMH